MNLRQWNKNHTFGIILALLLPILFLPIVLSILAWVEVYNFTEAFDMLWSKFKNNNEVTSKMITLAILANLGVFYIFLNKERYHFATGMILGTMLYLPIVLYFLFF